jgi:hypothetical protein
MSLRNLLIYSVILVILSIVLTKHYWPSVRIETKIEEREVVRNRIRTVIREVKKPDGTTETETETTDNSEHTRNRSESKSQKPPTAWHASLSARSELPFSQPEYVIQLERRILGPFFLGGGYATDKTVSLSLGMEF